MTTLSITIAAEADDGQSGTGSGFSATGSTIVLGGYFGTANGWFRATNVTIGGGATISSATLTGDRQTSAGTADLIFRFEKSTNPSNPSNGTDYDSRTLTTASATGSYSGTGAFTSANYATSAQEVINQGGWSSGNAQLLLVKDNNSNANHGGFENRFNLKTYAWGSAAPTLNWTYSTAITAALPAGQVTIGGVAPTVRKTAAAAVGTLTIGGVAATTRKRVAAAVGSIAIVGVAPAAYVTAPLPAGQVSIGGVATTAKKAAAAAVGQVAIGGVSLSSRKTDTPLVGEVEFAARPRKEIQELNFGGATFGNLFISCPGVFSFAVQSVTATPAQWESAINNTATVTAVTGGIRFNFTNRDVAQISIDINTSDGTPTVTTLQQGRSEPLIVKKAAAIEAGQIAIAGGEPAAAKQIAAAVGQVVIGGVGFSDAIIAPLPVGQIAIAGVVPTAYRYFAATASFAGCLRVAASFRGSVTTAASLAGKVTLSPAFVGTLEIFYMTCDGDLVFGDLLINNTTDVKIVGLKADGAFVNDATCTMSLTKNGVAVDGATGLSLTYSGTPGEYKGLLPHTLELEDGDDYRLTATATKTGVAVGQWVADLVACVRPASRQQ